MHDLAWIAIAVLSTLMVYFFVGYRFKDSFKSMEDFFNYSRSLPINLFNDTFIVTNVTFTSIYLVICQTTYERGNLTLWIPIAWVIGLIFFRFFFVKILPFFASGHTLPEYLGSCYNDKSLRKLASICLLIVFLGTLSIEFWGVVILLESLGLNELLTRDAIAVVVALITGLYTALGGFKAAVHTDRLQKYLILALTLFLLLIAFNCFGILPSIDKAARKEIIVTFINPGTLFSLSDWPFILGMFILFVPFNFCVMDMWQRCSALPEKERIDAIKSVGSLKNIVTFVVVFSVPVILGIVAQKVIPQEKINNPIMVLPNLLEMISSSGWLRILFKCVIYSGFVAALLSTADTLLINIVYTFLYDLLGPLRGIDYSKLSSTQQQDAIWIFRFWVFVFVLMSLPLILLGFSLYELVFAVFSSQIVVFVPILYTTFEKKSSSFRKRGAWWSILTGFVVAVFAVVIGHCANIRELTEGSPILAFIISTAVFFLFPLSSENQILEEPGE